MPGPAPKDPAIRQRANKHTTKTELPELERGVEGVPELPALARNAKWDPSVLTWWDLLWSSPMATRFPPSEVSSLVMIARLRHDFMRATKARDRVQIAAEIRQEERRWGLDEMSRRSLQWSFEDSGVRQAKALPPAELPEDDPRLLYLSKGRSA